MEIYRCLKAAKEMDVDPVFAMNARRRCLAAKLWEINEETQQVIAVPWFEGWDVALSIVLMRGLEDSKYWIKKELRIIDRMIIKREDQITDEMIERANSTPIETVMEFIHGKARCLNPDHVDKNPSMFHGRRTNHAICPVCGYKADAIEAHRRVWGSTFKEAVKALQ